MYHNYNIIPIHTHIHLVQYDIIHKKSYIIVLLLKSHPSEMDIIEPTYSRKVRT